MLRVIYWSFGLSVLYLLCGLRGLMVFAIGYGFGRSDTYVKYRYTQQVVSSSEESEATKPTKPEEPPPTLQDELVSALRSLGCKAREAKEMASKAMAHDPKTLEEALQIAFYRKARVS